MLAPADRRLLLDAVAPPDGFGLDQAIGTTYTLDLLALLRVPLAATTLPWSEGDGEPVSNPFALLSALRSHADRISLFCHAGAIKVPPAQQSLFAFLEGCVNQVVPPRGGIFHPKLWLLRFAERDGSAIAYRLLVLSRNLTFDRCWDIALVLDGKRTGRVRKVNDPLSELLSALPQMATAAGRPIDAATAARVAQLGEEVRRVQWEDPEDLELVQFHTLGIDHRPRWPFPYLYKLLVVAPFVRAATLAELGGWPYDKASLVARYEELAKLPAEVFEGFAEVFAFDDGQGLLDADNPDGDDGLDELAGLHAKLFLGEADRRARLWVGSANASEAALGTPDAPASNVELLVELDGVRSRHGIAATRDGLLDSGLLRPFVPSAEPQGEDSAEELLQRDLEKVATQLASGALCATVVTEGTERHRIEIRRAGEAIAIDAEMTVEIRPITVSQSRTAHFDRDLVVTFPVVALVHLTSFFAFSIVASRGGLEKRHDFVARLELADMPAGRTEAVIVELLSNRDRLIAFLLLLLAADGGDAEAALDSLEHLGQRGDPRGRTDGVGLPLLEPMLRALDRDPDRLEEIARLLGELDASEQTARLIPDELRTLWKTIEEVRSG